MYIFAVAPGSNDFLQTSIIDFNVPFLWKFYFSLQFFQMNQMLVRYQILILKKKSPIDNEYRIKDVRGIL